MKVKKKTYLYLQEHLYKAYGVKVIVDYINKNVENVEVVFSLDKIPDGSWVIPYGVLESQQILYAHNLKNYLSLLIDAYSLGSWSNFKCFVCKSYIPLSYKIKCLLRYFKFLYIEYMVLSRFERIVLVSWGDKSYYEKLWFTKKYAHKITVIPNGIVIPERRECLSVKKGVFRIGCLSAWNTHTIYPFYMFLHEVWNKMPNNGELELVVAGRGLTEKVKNYMKKFRNVRIIGEVNKLDEFYDEIDASLVTMVKKCGIINRVLDGFSYQIPVICRPENLLAFKDLPDCCYLYTDVNSFKIAINRIREKPSEAKEKTQKAYEYIQKYNDWDTNYKNFGKLLK